MKSRVSLLALAAGMVFQAGFAAAGGDEVLRGFRHPGDMARPGVYWYVMDGTLSRDGITSDLVSMKKAGIRSAVFQEINVGVPRGKVDFLSPEWQKLFEHMIREAERLGIEIKLAIGPGWTGSGGPWVRPEDSMQDLVSTSVVVSPDHVGRIVLPKPESKPPYFGEATLTPGLKKEWRRFYRDVAVLAFPLPENRDKRKIPDIDDKALYYREPYTSVKGVKPYFPQPASFPADPAGAVKRDDIIDLTGKLGNDGVLDWTPPPGKWVVMRFGVRNNGAVTRPAPVPGLGFECDKFSTSSLHKHLDAYVGKLLKGIGGVHPDKAGGLKALHMDSWEMGAQNWTPGFREEFRKRRGYDPQPYFPVYAGQVVESREISERFLWDLRETAQELVLEHHAEAVRDYAHGLGLRLSIEPYDMNPTSDLELGAVADIPMCEFWSVGHGFNSAFSCLEAASIGHVEGRRVVAAESFTGDPGENWLQYPGSMKNQADWAFACGINRFFIHTFAHQALDDSLRPGMAMGPYGVHWDRHNTWWSMAGAFDEYAARCSAVLQEGRTVADILYLAPEGAPTVFVPPPSALAGDAFLPDRKGLNFDGCSPGELLKSKVKHHRIVFPSGASYGVLVLPLEETMTSAMLEKVQSLIQDGAMVVGRAPVRSPGLSGYPGCDETIRKTAQAIWGENLARTEASRRVGEGTVWSGGALDEQDGKSLYPRYDVVAKLLHDAGIVDDFASDGPIRYTHRTGPGWDVYFVSNRENRRVSVECRFRSGGGVPLLMDPVTGKTWLLSDFRKREKTEAVPLTFEPYQGYFLLFGQSESSEAKSGGRKTGNFETSKPVLDITGPWDVSFEPNRGAPAKASFAKLEDWTLNTNSGIRFFSGCATYRKTFRFDEKNDLAKQGVGHSDALWLDLGTVHDIARVKLNGKDLGVVWTAPWRVDVSSVLKSGENRLEIVVANRWANRLIGDENLPDDEILPGSNKWPDWVLKGEKRPTDRISFSTYRPYRKDSPLLPSGLIGPVRIERETGK